MKKSVLIEILFIVVISQFSAFAGAKKEKVSKSDKATIKSDCTLSSNNDFPVITRLITDLEDIYLNWNKLNETGLSKKLHTFVKNVNSIVDKGTVGSIYFVKASELNDEIDRNSTLLPECSEIEEQYGIKEIGMLSSGSNGTVFTGCLGSNCNVVIKKQNYNLDDAIIENHLFSLLSPELAPKPMGAYLCKKAEGTDTSRWTRIYHNIILEKMDGSLRSYFEKENPTDDQIVKIFNLVGQMHKKNIVHQDLHTGNILVKVENNEPKFYLTDFGCASLYSTGDRAETSRACQNFRMSRTSGTKEKQMRYDYDCLIYDFKRKFDVDIRVHLKKSKTYIPAKDYPSSRKHLAIELDE
jgi:serine/threonine protein kinase